MSIMNRTAIGLIALAITTAAQADPVQLTRGAIYIDVGYDWFDFGGAGLEARGATPDTPLLRDFPNFCRPCRPGEDIIDLSFSTPGHVDAGSGSATFAGRSYSELFYQARFSVTAVGHVFPTRTDDFIRIAQPFELTGSLRAFLDPEFSSLAFATALRGQGRADLRFWYDQTDRVYRASEDQLAYRFQEPAAVPEPATLVLSGLGLAALAVRRRRRRVA